MAGSVQSVVLAVSYKLFTRLPYSPTGLDQAGGPRFHKMVTQATSMGVPLRRVSPGPALGPALEGYNINSKGIEMVNLTNELPASQICAGSRVR